MIDTTTKRLRYEATLRPAIGSTFQPTGFPDIGPAEFDHFTADTATSGNGATEKALLVESVQSMANRLEATAWDPAAQAPVELFARLPYVRVHRHNQPDEFLTSSRQEAHRLTSAFVREAELDGDKMLHALTRRLGLARDTPLDYPAMARAVLTLDPFCLIHGVFFNHKEWHGQPKFPRAASAVIEAYDVRPVLSGGRKTDRVRHQLDKETPGGGTTEGYGSVPFHRVEYTARDIRAMFSVDVELLRSYRLGDGLTGLLTDIALWEIRALVSGGLRLRTACDLELTSDLTPADGGEALPGLDQLGERVAAGIDRHADAFGDQAPITVHWKG